MQLLGFINKIKKSHSLSHNSDAYLVVCAVVFAAFAALEEISSGATSLGHLVVVNRFLCQLGSQLFHFIAGHLLISNNQQFTSISYCLNDYKINCTSRLQPEF